MKKKRVAILGAGNWGTTLSLLLESRGHSTSLWEPSPERAKELLVCRENRQYLPEVPIPREIHISSDLGEVTREAGVLIFARPTHGMREVARRVSGLNSMNPLTNPLVVSFSKGLEERTHLRMSQVLGEELPEGWRVAVLSGPTIANEVVKGMTTTAVASAQEIDVAEEVQNLITSDSFRVYTSSDVTGVELGGALKNVITIAAGIGDGLDLGANAKGALLTRGMAEITRLGVQMGAQALTFSGLSGMGDLITTATSPHSRNRYLGMEIGRGKSLEKILSEMVMVAEGVKTTKVTKDLAERYHVEMPITLKVYEVLFEGKDPKEGLSELMERNLKSELG